MSTKSKGSEKALSELHARVGWWSLIFFVVLGLVLEGLHGLKLGWYLDRGQETRRLLLTLSHAHGALLSLLHLIVGLGLRTGFVAASPPPMLASRCLLASLVLIPGGFLAGGLLTHGADAGLGVLLVPVGALALIVGLVQLARAGRGDA